MVEVNDRKSHSIGSKNLRCLQWQKMIDPEMLFYDIIAVFVLDIKVKHMGLDAWYGNKIFEEQ